jgi:hypothetical protein
MKIKLLITSVTVFFLLAAGAQAFQWHMTYNQAKHSSKEFAIEACHEDRRCSGYGVGQCRRISESRFDCLVGLFFADPSGSGEEVECDLPLHWGASYEGYIELKNHGKPHCFPI